MHISEPYRGRVANNYWDSISRRKDALVVSLRDGLWIYALSIDMFWAKHAQADPSRSIGVSYHLHEEEREWRTKRTKVKVEES